MRQQTRLKAKWKSKGYFVINLIRVTPIGLPDLICVKPNHVLFVESKEKRDRLSKLQLIVLKKLTQSGFDCYVNDDKYELKP